MSATLVAPAAPSATPTTSGSPLGILLRLRLRRDRLQLIVWLGAIFVLALFSASALASTYSDAAQRASIVRLASIDPSVLALRGAPQGTSLGAFTSFEIISYLALMAALMSTFMAVRHTRADEESGRAELVGGTRAGRLAPTIATAIEGFIANVGVAVAVALGFALTGLDPWGSIVAGLGTAACGFAFIGVGLACAQLFSTGRAANGMAAALVIVAFVLRAAGDSTGTVSADGLFVTSGAASWFSPIGWTQQTHPYTDNNLWPALAGLALGLVLIVATVALQAARDSGAGIVPSRGGRATAPATLAGPIGLAWRLQRGSIIGWGAGAIVLSALVGGLGPTAIKTLGTNNATSKTLEALVPGGSGGLLDLFVAGIAGIIGLVVAGFALQTVMRLRQEEAFGTAEAVLAAGVGRIRWFSSYLILGAVFSAVILFLSGVAGGAGAANAGQSNAYGDWIGACMVQLPAVFVYLTVLGFVFGLVPRATIGVGWGMLAVGAFFGEFGGLLNLPDWIRNISPSTHTPAVPTPNPDWSGAWWMLAISILAFVIGCIVVRRRDLAVG